MDAWFRGGVGQKHRRSEGDGEGAAQPNAKHSRSIVDDDMDSAVLKDGTSTTACHRVMLTPELATLVFLHLDKPDNFNATCRLFHDIATNPATVYTWHARRVWKCETFCALIIRKGLRKPRYIDFFLDHREVPVSRRLLCHIHTHRTTVARSAGSGGDDLLSVELLRRLPNYVGDGPAGGTISTSDATDVATAIFHHHPGLGPLQSLAGNNRTAPDRAFLENLFSQYQLPAYERTGLHSLLAAILLVGRDLDWWAGIMRRFAGFYQLVPDDLLDGVLHLLIYVRPMIAPWSGFLTGVSASILTNTTDPLPSVSVRLLEQSGGALFWKHICKVPWTYYRSRSYPGSLLPLSGSAPVVHLDPALQILRNTFALLERKHAYEIFLARYLYMAARLQPRNKDVFGLTIVLYMQGVQDKIHLLPEDLRTQIFALLLTAVACSVPADIGKPNHYSKLLKLHQCWSPESMSIALANPSLSVQEASLVKSFFARRAPKNLHLDKILASACRMLLNHSSSGGLFTEYSQTSSWIPSHLEEVIRENGASTIFDSYDAVHVDESDPMQVGIRAALSVELSKFHGKEPAQPSTIPTAVGLLSILDRQTSCVLPVILVEARKRGESRIIELYQRSGITAV